MRQAVLLPLALEYPFWEERRRRRWPASARRSPPADADLGAADWTPILESDLEAAQDALAARRSPATRPASTSCSAAAAGVGGVYDAWRRLKARFGGERSGPSTARRMPHSRVKAEPCSPFGPAPLRR